MFLKTYGFWPLPTPMFYFYSPWKRHKSSGFMTFSGGVEVEHLGETGCWREMGYNNDYLN